MATSVKRASDLTSDQSINLGIAFFHFFFFFFYQRFTHDSNLIAANNKKEEESLRLWGLETLWKSTVMLES